MKPAIIGIPWDENSSYLRGAAQAPHLIREALACDSSNLWSENGIDFGASPIFDAGDVESLSGAAMLSKIEESILSLLEQEYMPVSLGGDHAITYPIVRAFAKKYRGLSI